MENKIKIVIADDHEIFRDGLVLMLSRQANLQLVGQAENGRELLQLVKEQQPDIVLTDIKMPLMDGVESTRQLTGQWPDLKIIALSMFDEEDLVVDMLEAGAKGYLLKNADKPEILEAIESVYNDQPYYCRRTTSKLATLIARSKSPANQKKAVTFSDREIEIIKLICQQYTAKQIADIVFLSKRTVEGHRIKILEKMNVKNTAGVVVYALTHHIISEKELEKT